MCLAPEFNALPTTQTPQAASTCLPKPQISMPCRDHSNPAGCQYLSAKTPEFQALLEGLQGRGLLARWGQGGSVGDVQAGPDGRLLLEGFQPYPGA